MGLVTKRLSSVQPSWNGWKYQNAAQVPAQGAATSWSSLRDVALHIQKNDYYRPYLTISWTDAYIAAAMTERIYLLGPTGRLIRRLLVSSTSGSTTIQLTGGYGQYTLHIPGYSTRNWTVSVPNAYPNQIEPVKTHQSQGATPTVYLKVPANTGFTLCGRRDTSGITAVTITNVADELDTYTLNLTTQTYYDQYNSSVRSSTGVDRVFAVTFTGSGRTAYWVDGIPNLFAKAQAQLFDLTNSAGTASVTVGDEIGDVPLLGATLPYQTLTGGEETVIESWGMTATSRYHLQTHLTNNPSHDVAFLEYDRDTLNVDGYLQTLRVDPTVISNTATTISFYETYADARITANLLTDAYFAFADEPNLNYTTVTDFEAHFSTIATALKNNADPQVASMKLAFPQSSKMLHGPLTDGSDARRGYDMIDRVLPDHWDLIDAITWHSWNIRDLINTDFYYDEITAVYDLMVSHMPTGGSLKPLMIGQTNIQSGNTTSTYEQDTFYASQWWASVFIQCARTGKLQSLIWFLALSNGHEKGFATTTLGVTTEKIVADAQRFLTDHMGATVLSTTSNHPELDVVVMRANDDSLRVIGVNKGPRSIAATITLPESVVSFTRYLLDEGGPSSDTVSVNGNTVSTTIPANTIFALGEATELITINGTGFGTRASLEPVFHEFFDNNTFTEGALASAFGLSADSNLTATKVDGYYTGGGCFTFTTPAGSEYFPHLYYAASALEYAFVQIVFKVQRVSGTASTGFIQVKAPRVANDAEYVGTPRATFSLYPSADTATLSHTNLGLITATINDGSDDYGSPADYKTGFLSGQFNLLETEFSAGTLNNVDGYTKPILNGEIIGPITTGSFDSDAFAFKTNAAHAIDFVSLFPGITSYTVSDQYRMRIAEIVIDDTPARIVVGNAATWANCTKKLYHIPASWSDTQVTANWRVIPWANSGDTVYGYVVNSDGTVSSATSLQVP